ncbi:MAG: c-type cytochrome [Bacteroidia bacterium]
MTDNKDKLISRMTNAIIGLFLIIVALVIFCIYLLFLKQGDTGQIKCGGAVPPIDTPVNSENAKGEKLFKQNCSTCHRLDDKKLTGPGLKDVFDRAPSEEWVYHFILNSDSMIKAKDPYSLKIAEEWGDLKMTSFTYLREEEIREIMKYIRSSGPIAMPATQ